jgi:hypothetical protein
MHRNRWWLTPRGTTLDAGALVAGLEYSAERRATLTGKPSPTFFAAGVRVLAEDLGRPRLRRHEVLMVGDDLERRPRRPAGRLRGAFVRAASTTAEARRGRASTRGRGRPDAIAGRSRAVISMLVDDAGPIPASTAAADP